MQQTIITREQAEKNSMPEGHLYGVISEGATGYWGTGATEEEAIADAEAHVSDLDDCWMEVVDSDEETEKMAEDTETQAALQACVKLTGGQIVGECVVYYDDAMSRYYVADIDAAESALEYVDQQDGYSLWCAANEPGRAYRDEDRAIAAAEDAEGSQAVTQQPTHAKIDPRTNLIEELIYEGDDRIANAGNLCGIVALDLGHGERPHVGDEVSVDDEGVAEVAR